MELRHEQAEQTVQRIFGSGATLGGSIGSGKHPGRLTILVDGMALGSGATLQEAIGVATRRAQRPSCGCAVRCTTCACSAMVG